MRLFACYVALFCALVSGFVGVVSNSGPARPEHFNIVPFVIAMSFLTMIFLIIITTPRRRNLHSEVFTDKDWDAQNRLKQMKHRQAALRN